MGPACGNTAWWPRRWPRSFPDLVQYSETGEPSAVRYHFVNAMLLNEVQRQHQQIADLTVRLAKLEASGQRADR